MGNSRLRPETRSSNQPAPVGGTAYLMIYNAVREQDGLIHGKLHDDKGWSCAIGSFFAVNPHQALHYDLIDEVAAVNDSAPNMTKKQRKNMVTRWLRWKLTQYGMPGFKTFAL